MTLAITNLNPEYSRQLAFIEFYALYRKYFLQNAHKKLIRLWYSNMETVRIFMILTMVV